MKDPRYSDPQLFEAFVKSAQYLVRLNTQQDVWDHLGKFITTYFPADWTALVQRDSAGKVSIQYCNLPGEAVAQTIRTDEVRTLIADVLDSGFFASQTILTPSPSMTVFLPIAEEHKVILIGHKTGEPLPKELLNIYLAIAGLAGTAFERLRAEVEAHESEKRYRMLFDAIDEGFCIIEMIFDKHEKAVDFRYLEINPSFEKQTGLIDVQGKRIRELAPKLEEYWFEIYGKVALSGEPARFQNRAEELNRWYDVYAIRFGQPETRQVAVLFNDITERKRSEEVLRASVRLSEFALKHSLEELLTNGLDEAESLTGSRIGFFHFVDPDQKTLQLQTWSTNTLENMCAAEGKGLHYSVDKAGVWVDAVRQKAPVIHNDYVSLPHKRGLPPGHAPVIRELVVPILRSGQVMGVMGVGNKPREYDAQDINTISRLANLAWDIIIAKRAEEALALQARHASLGADVGVEITRGDTLRAILQGCAEAMVRRLDGAFSRIWTVNRDGNMLELQASAGMYTHIDGPSARVPLDADRKIALIARTRKPHLTNCVIGDSLIIDQGWAVKEGMVSFAGYPLVIEDRVIGVMALFSRKPLPEVTLNALASIADGISIGIERMRADDEIKKLNEDLEKRVVERTTELTAVNKELEAFTYSVSHDLRAPLRHIHGFVDLLVQTSGQNLDDKGKRYLATISKAASQMGNLVDDLLTFSRMGRTEIKKHSVDLENMVYGVIDEMKYELRERDIEWKVGSLAPVYGDPSLLRLVMVNLIANAAKFTRQRDKAVIEIGSYTEAGGEDVVYVKDNGVGFDMRYVDKLFGVFQRLHSIEEFEGTGIGLANIRRIISRHGGRTWAEGALGTGAAFYFSLPSKDGDNV